METSHTDPSHCATTFLFCFWLYDFTGVRRFLLLFTFLKYENFDFWPCFWLSRVCFFLVFHSSARVCVVGGGGRRSASSYSSMGTFRPNPSIRPLLSYLVLLSSFTGVRRFFLCLHSWHEKFLTFDHFPCILECLFSFSFILVWRGRRAHRPTTPPTHTHTIESKETKTSTLECIESNQKLRISHVKNVNKRKKSSYINKFRQQKKDKKVMAQRERSGWEVSINP